MRKVLLGLALAAIAPNAHADFVTGTRSEKLVERSHVVSVRLSPERATLVATRVLENGGPRHDQALVDIDLPPGAVATRMRTLGFVAGEKRWFEGDLMEAEQAAAKYRELTGLGGHYPKDPALLSWQGQGALVLQVFPCLPRAEKQVEYTLTIPTRYGEGAYHVDLPRFGTPTVAAVATAFTAAGNRLFLDGKPLANGATFTPGERIVVRDGAADIAGEPSDLSLRTPPPPALDGELVTISVSDHRALVRFAVRAAP